MKDNLKEAVPIGRLLGVGGKTIGWVYRWNTSDISILWLFDVHDPILFEFSPLPSSDSATNEAIEDFLRDFRADGDKG